MTAVDGDSGFHPLRDGSFQKIMNNFNADGTLNIQGLVYEDFTGLLVCDGPHLLKRARYRILKKIITSSGLLDSLLLSTDELKEVLELADAKILNDSTTAKMRDDLAHKLFSAEQI